MVLVPDTSSLRGLQVYQVSLKNLQRFTSYRADTICDGQTDRQTDRQTDARGKTICLPTLSGGDIIKQKNTEIFTRFASLICIVGSTANDLVVKGMDWWPCYQ